LRLCVVACASLHRVSLWLHRVSLWLLCDGAVWDCARGLGVSLRFVHACVTAALQ
jgi:hypothetical protein